MFTREEDVEAYALRAQGWSISAIAPHLGRDRKTVRAHLERRREPEARVQDDDPFEPFVAYVRQRLHDDRHLRASVLDRELHELGLTASYQTLTRETRAGAAAAVRGVLGREGSGHYRDRAIHRARKRSGTGSSCRSRGVCIDSANTPRSISETPWGSTGLVQVGALSYTTTGAR